MGGRKGRIRALEILAGACGGLAGMIGFIPFLLLSGVVRRKFVEKGGGIFGFFLLVPLLSFIPMVAAIALCWWLASAYLMIFAVVCIVVFLLATTVYTATRVRR
jgi:hypothetical protein